MTNSDKTLIAFIEFIVNPKVYLESKYFLKHTTELKYRQQEYLKDYENLQKKLKDYEEIGYVPNSVCSNGHKYDKPELNEFQDENVSNFFCPECYIKQEELDIIELEKKSKKEKVFYSTFKVVTIVILAYFLYELVI
jgi:hypothetical protein